jgi:hypothetical protein
MLTYNLFFSEPVEFRIYLQHLELIIINYNMLELIIINYNIYGLICNKYILYNGLSNYIRNEVIKFYIEFIICHEKWAL